MATNLSYNGISILCLETRQFDQELVYDESGTDPLYHKFTVGVVGHAHAQNSITRISPAYADVVTTEIATRQALLEPRKDFTFTVGGNVLLISGGSPGLPNYDVDNGPKPKHVRVTKIVGSLTMRVEFVIEICIVDCNGDSNQSGVLNNRWSMEESFDQDWYSTRTISGRIRIKSNTLNPQAFRGWVVPPLQAGFKRESMRFVTSRNGLEMDYTITDKQVWAACPVPGTTWDVVHTESTGDGVSMFGEVRIELKGPPKCNKKLLVQLAAQIVETSLGVFLSGVVEDKKYIIVSAALVDYKHDSRIAMTVRVQRLGEVDKIFSLAGALIGTPLQLPNYDQGRSPVPTQEDLADPLGLFICYLQTPCDDQHGIQQETYAVSAPVEGGESGTVEAYQTDGDLPPYPPAQWSQSHSEAIYTHYEISKRYLVNHGNLQLPTSGAAADSEAATSRVVQLHSSVARLLVTIRAERNGQPPELPTLGNFTDATGLATLLRHEFEPDNALNPDASTSSYSAEAKYLYALPRAPRANEYSSGRYPHIKYEGGFSPAFPESSFTEDILQTEAAS